MDGKRKIFWIYDFSKYDKLCNYDKNGRRVLAFAEWKDLLQISKIFRSLIPGFS